MPIQQNKFLKPKTYKPASHPFCRIRRAWVVEWGDGKAGFHSHEETLSAQTEQEAIAEAAEMSGMLISDVEVEG